jgi:hypothetical protein
MSKQKSLEILGLAQKRRLRDLQGDLLRIVGAVGFSRSLLWKRTPWDEAGRDPNNYQPFRPYERLQSMVRDVTRAVRNRGNDAEIEAVRKAVTAFYETALRDALEPLGRESETEVIALYIAEKRDVAEAECAQAIAMTSPTPENFDTALRETSIAKSDVQRLMDRLETARRNVMNSAPVRMFR